MTFALGVATGCSAHVLTNLNQAETVPDRKPTKYSFLHFPVGVVRVYVDTSISQNEGPLKGSSRFNF